MDSAFPNDAIPTPARPLDRSSVVPLYHQLYIDLRRRLMDGEWEVGAPFPKDSDIEAAYGVSRITVRQAMAQLVDGNFVIRFRGRGTFVGNLPRQGAVVNHRIVADEIAASGRRPSHENLGPIERYAVSDVTADQFGVAIGAPVLILKRLHRADDIPVCLESIMLLEDRFPTVFDWVVQGEETLTDAYDRLGIDVAKSEQTVSTTMLSEERRHLLDLPNGVPALVVERVGLAPTSEVLDVRRLFYRGDQHALRQENRLGIGEPADRLIATSLTRPIRY